MKPLECRVAQLDLARQMETPEFIRRFIDLLSASGYNLLLLYLEDRVITAHYQLPSPDEAYTEDQIRELVAYGASRGVELFPCVPTLGHGERFLAHPELAHFAEVKDGVKGRFGGSDKNTFCVCEDGFYEFLFEYIRDVSALFPSKYFHVGLDEFWDFNLCPKCRAQAPDRKGEEQLYLKHVLKVHDFLKSLGKRMVMFDDMFDVYPEVLEGIPRDVIMANWQYQPDVRFGKAHFDNQAVLNTLGGYDTLGFEAFPASWDMNLQNSTSMMTYMERHPCVKGLLLTSWEKSDYYMLRHLPVVAVVGRMLNGASQDQAVRDSNADLFGIRDEGFDRLMAAVLNEEFLWHFQSSNENLMFSRSHLGLKRGHYEADRMIYGELRHWMDYAPKGKDVLQDLLELYEERLLAFELKKECVDSLDFGLTAERRAAIVELQRRYLAFYERRAREWKAIRPGIVPNRIAEGMPMLRQRMQEYLRRLEQGAFVKVRLMHADWYGMPRLRLSLKVQGTWTCLLDDCILKPDDLENQLTDAFIPCSEEELSAEAVRFEVTGFGGLGIAYVELRRNGEPLRVPAAILETENKAEDPENMLTNNSCWCYFGSQNMRETFRHGERFAVRHRADVTLKDYAP